MGILLFVKSKIPSFQARYKTHVEGTYVPYVLRLPIGQIVQQIFGKTHFLF